MRQCNFQQQHLHNHHNDRLDQQRGIIPRARPIKDFQDTRRQHDERNIEGEAGRGAGAVDGGDLVGIGDDRGEDETVGYDQISMLVGFWKEEVRDAQERGEVGDSPCQ